MGTSAWTPVDETAAAWTPVDESSSMLKTVGQGINDAIQGIGSGALLSGATIYDLGRRAIGKPSIMQNPTTQALITPPPSLIGKLAHGAEQVGEFFLPSGAEKFLAEKLALPALGKAAEPLAKIAANALTTGTVNKAQGGSFTAGAAGGAVAGGLAEGAKAIAPSIAEAALGISRKNRMYGKTPGLATLEEITGLSPANIADNAQAKATQLTSLLESAAAGTTTTTTIKPAVDIVDAAMAKAQVRNSTGVYQKLQLLRDQLTHDLFTGQQFPVNRSATDILNAKRGIGDLVNSWSDDERKGVQAVLPQVYRALDSQLDSIVPGADSINQRISSLIPVAKRAAAKAEGAGTAQRIAGRVSAHTGALTGVGVGAMLGYREGGAEGALLGGTAGAVIPELISSPTVQMALARQLAKEHAIPLNTAKAVVLHLVNQANTPQPPPALQ